MDEIVKETCIYWKHSEREKSASRNTHRVGARNKRTKQKHRPEQRDRHSQCVQFSETGTYLFTTVPMLIGMMRFAAIGQGVFGGGRVVSGDED